MHSFYRLVFQIFTTFQHVTAYRFLEPRFFNPPKQITASPTSLTPATSTIGQSISPIVSEFPSAYPPGVIACVPPIETFTVTYASISACPDCASYDHTTPENYTAQGLYNSTHRTLETFKFRFRNPTLTAEDISCHLSWDTSLASPDKYPIAKQMFCDKNSYNQLNAVLEKQESGITAGFYLFVWNNNQMETMVAWMVEDIKHLNETGFGWKNGTHDGHERVFHEGHVNLDSMPTMLLTEWLNVTGNFTG